MVHRNQRSDGGTGVISSLFGAVAFLLLLMLAAHTLVSLYATSVLTSVTWDEARKLADSTGDSGAIDTTVADTRRRLGNFRGLDVNAVITPDDIVTLTVSAQRPALLPIAMRAQTGVARIARTAVVRQERMR